MSCKVRSRARTPSGLAHADECSGRPAGGFGAFAAAYSDKIDRTALVNTSKGLSLRGAPWSGGGGVLGGAFNCPLPAEQSAVNPFFSNIRQNMDLIDGVGEIPIHLPAAMGSTEISQLPAWLGEVSRKDDGSKVVAERFLKIERAEQRRMQDALNVSVVYDSPTSSHTKSHTLAGVEKGNKNRYNNIWPYDHSRVKLQEYPDQECDYVNASHISVPHSRKRYIASQAPLPSTFRVRLLLRGFFFAFFAFFLPFFFFFFLLSCFFPPFGD